MRQDHACESDDPGVVLISPALRWKRESAHGLGDLSDSRRTLGSGRVVFVVTEDRVLGALDGLGEGGQGGLDLVGGVGEAQLGAF